MGLIQFQKRVGRLKALLERLPSEVDRVGAADCQDIAEELGLQPLETRNNGAMYYSRVELDEGIGKLFGQAQQLAASLDTAGNAPLPSSFTETAMEVQMPKPEPLSSEPEAQEVESPGEGAPPPEPITPATDTDTGFNGLDSQIVVALNDNGVHTLDGLRRYLETGGNLTDLEGIGEGRAKTLDAFLKAPV